MAPVKKQTSVHRTRVLGVKTRTPRQLDSLTTSHLQLLYKILRAAYAETVLHGRHSQNLAAMNSRLSQTHPRGVSFRWRREETPRSGETIKMSYQKDTSVGRVLLEIESLATFKKFLEDDIDGVNLTYTSAQKYLRQLNDVVNWRGSYEADKGGVIQELTQHVHNSKAAIDNICQKLNCVLVDGTNKLEMLVASVNSEDVNLKPFELYHMITKLIHVLLNLFIPKHVCESDTRSPIEFEYWLTSGSDELTACKSLTDRVKLIKHQAELIVKLAAIIPTVIPNIELGRMMRVKEKMFDGCVETRDEVPQMLLMVNKGLVGVATILTDFARHVTGALIRKCLEKGTTE